MLVNRLTIGGRHYFLPDPVDDIRARVLDAARNGGEWVVLEGWRRQPAATVFVSRGTAVVWARIDVEEPVKVTTAADNEFALDSFGDY